MCASAGSDMGGGAVFAGGLVESSFYGCTFTENRGSNGGAINNRGSTLTIINCEFVGNEAHGSGGGGSGNGGIGGAVYIDGMNYDVVGDDLIACGNRFEGNLAGDHASAMFCHFYEGSRSTVDTCEFVDNHITGEGAGLGALYHQDAPLSLLRSTFSENSTNNHAGAVFIGQSSPTDISNCTFHANSSAQDGVGGALFAGNNDVNVTNCTFTANAANYGPAIFSGEEGHVTLTNTILSDNEVTGEGEYNGTSCCFTLFDGGNNLQWPTQRANGTDDTPCVDGITFADPLLLGLADNGGPMPTIAIDDDSPAIDGASGCPSTDQRGFARVGECDIGSFEYQP